MGKPRDDKDDEEQRIPGQSVKIEKSYPEGMERERQEPAEGYDKPRPSCSDNKR